jgi:hypothetical protein
MTTMPTDRRTALYKEYRGLGASPEEAAEAVERAIGRDERVAASSVRSAPLATPRVTSSSRIVGLFALLFGIPLWLEAARFTRDGWILFIDWLCARFSIPWQVPALSWWVAILLIAILGFGYSYVEMVKQPVRMPKEWRRDFFKFKLWTFERRWEAWIVWAVLIASDVGTTYAGAKNPDPSGLSLMRDIISSSVALAGYAIILTFIPDRLVRFGWRAIKGG